MRSERFDTPGPVALSVALPAGEIHVRAAETAETTVELEPLNNAAEDALPRATVRQSGSGGDVTVELDERRTRFFGRTPSVRATITCPVGTRLRVRAVSADVEARGRFGEAEVNTVSGDVELDEVEGDFALKTVSGDADVARVAGEARLQTVSGDVTLRAVHHGVSARSVSGDVELGAVHEGTVRVQSVSGDTQIGVAPGAHVFVDAKSVSGDMRSELAVSDAPPATANGRPLELHVKSVSGDVTITRA